MDSGDGDENSGEEKKDRRAVPMKGPGQDQVVIYGQFVEGGIEVALEDEAAGFIDDNEGVDDPDGG